MSACPDNIASHLGGGQPGTPACGWGPTSSELSTDAPVPPASTPCQSPLAASEPVLPYGFDALASADAELIWISRDGDITEVDPDFGIRTNPDYPRYISVSRDGRRVTGQDHADPSGDVWVKELDRGPVSRLTFLPGTDGAPVWSEDGGTIYFLSDRDGWGIWSRRADGPTGRRHR